MSANTPSGAPRLADAAQQYIEALRESARSGSSPWSAAGQPRPSVGDVWATVAGPGELPVLVAITWVGDDVHRAVPLLNDVRLAASDDIVVAAEDSPTETAVALCTWLDTPIASESLRELMGTLGDAVIEPLTMMLQSQLTGGFVRRALGSELLIDGEQVMQWSIGPESAEAVEAVTFLTGAPILRPDDPRLLVRAALIELTQFLPTLALATIPIDVATEKAAVWDRVRRLIAIPLEGFARIDQPAHVVLSDASSEMYEAFLPLPAAEAAGAYQRVRLIITRKPQSTRLRAELEPRTGSAREAQAITLSIKVTFSGLRAAAIPTLAIDSRRSPSSAIVHIPHGVDPVRLRGEVELTIEPSDGQEDE